MPDTKTPSTVLSDSARFLRFLVIGIGSLFFVLGMFFSNVIGVARASEVTDLLRARVTDTLSVKARPPTPITAAQISHFAIEFQSVVLGCWGDVTLSTKAQSNNRSHWQGTFINEKHPFILYVFISRDSGMVTKFAADIHGGYSESDKVSARNPMTREMFLSAMHKQCDGNKW